MQIPNGANPPTPKACPNLAYRYLLTLAAAGAEMVLLITIEVAL